MEVFRNIDKYFTEDVALFYPIFNQIYNRNGREISKQHTNGGEKSLDTLWLPPSSLLGYQSPSPVLLKSSCRARKNSQKDVHNFNSKIKIQAHWWSAKTKPRQHLVGILD
ncbi:hypothetical protein Pst134EA_025799 [Puccinia striiformis f. sp. tritici]|uniref:hypothetical protein n=1 Tax=Puccinia striiformis f. sp. tritici TaxID=168172 RepID=UPI00200809A3|nr:hypothetical protein Pst134EA_025799 [Puccinia striiformis f. sp. tritici]KAH9451859.1 hypothetical protein Pst134EA_025799 [Puccinia striiformis f. sp. tritici]